MEKKQGILLSDATVPDEPPPEYTAAAEHGEHGATPAGAAASTTPARSPGGAAGPAAGPATRRPPPPLELPLAQYLRGKRVILASASPRRRALLAQVGLGKLEIWPSELPEDLDKTAQGPFEYVAATANRKCMDVYQAALAAQAEAAEALKTGDGGGVLHEVPPDPELVIAADTIIVTRAGRILEKPRSEKEHVQMLRHLRDTASHRVLTAVCVLAPRADAAHPGYMVAAHTEETRVVFGRVADGLTDEVIERYVRTREGADKAGGYALQGTGGLVLVDHIEGSVDNVIGLPVRRCLQLMEKVLFRQNVDEFDEPGPSDEE